MWGFFWLLNFNYCQGKYFEPYARSLRLGYWWTHKSWIHFLNRNLSLKFWKGINLFILCFFSCVHLHLSDTDGPGCIVCSINLYNSCGAPSAVGRKGEKNKKNKPQKLKTNTAILMIEFIILLFHILLLKTILSVRCPSNLSS